jgi:hypothetical protein
MDTGHWILNEGVILTPETFGFIYEIECVPIGKKYIGKKQMVSRHKKKPLKGNKRKRIEYKESDWKTYSSSSSELVSDINCFGKDKFKFTIIKTCSCKWELAYFEAKLQFERDVLFSQNYYNGIINLRICRAPKSTLEVYKKSKNIL